MPRRRTVMLRVCIAAFALWLPAATGKGGKATCVAATSIAKSLTERPHLSCHAESGARKSCCCKGALALRAAACDCHDGQKMSGTAAHDPMIERCSAAPSADFAFAAVPGVAPSPDRERFPVAPDPPPPERFIRLYSQA